MPCIASILEKGAQPKQLNRAEMHNLDMMQVLQKIRSLSYSMQISEQIAYQSCGCDHLCAEVMSREHEVAAAAACQLTEQLALQQQQQAAKQALKQVCHLPYSSHLCPIPLNTEGLAGELLLRVITHHYSNYISMYWHEACS